LDYATKLIVILSVAGAVVLEAFLAARAWPNLLPLTIASFVVAAGATFFVGELSTAVVLFLTYLMPAVFLVTRGDASVFFGTIWLAALLGTTVPKSVHAPWSFPARWKVPLVLWAVTIALTWPVVVLRELDFKPALLLNVSRLHRWDLEVLRPIWIVWTCDVAATLGVGLLWFDWLFQVFSGDETRFRRLMLGALALSWAITTAVGIYQLFGDMLFLNFGLFGALKRATGTMRDANPFGIVAALGGPSLVAAATLTGRRWFHVLAGCGLIASWIGFWASGARSALGLAVVTTTAMASALWSARVAPRFSRRARILLGIAAAAAVVTASVTLFYFPAERGPVARLVRTLPAAWSLTSLRQFLWDRNGYGLVASDLIWRFPWFGIGVGSFNLFASDESFLLTGVRLPPDNAQNWFRHQLTEFGLVGSIGWMLWVVSFGWFVLSARAPQQTKFASFIVRGLIVGLALVSLVGMPTQNIAVAITFWTLAFWCVALVGEGPAKAGHYVREGPAAAPVAQAFRPATWLATWLIVAFSVGGTAYTARHRLRVAQRAVDIGFPYQYGFSEPQRVDLAKSSSGWTGRRAIAVLFPQTQWVKLAVSVDSLNLAKGPVDVKVWCAGQLVVDTQIRSVKPVTRYVHVPDGATRVLLETRVSRSVRPADFGMPDGRELGLLLDWDFVEAPPLGSASR
jgi:hypothetical protein